VTLQHVFTRPTASGVAFSYARVAPDMINERDLVHHMSRRECWGGNTDFSSYSVAQHALVTMSACRLPEARVYALLSAAPAAYLGWMDPALKLWLAEGGNDIIGLEHRIFTAVLEHFDVTRPSAEIYADVHQAEQRAQATEWRDVVRGRIDRWAPSGKPLAAVIRFKPQPKIEDELAAALERELRPFRERTAERSK
jgi:hypothetical protein